MPAAFGAYQPFNKRHNGRVRFEPELFEASSDIEEQWPHVKTFNRDTHYELNMGFARKVASGTIIGHHRYSPKKGTPMLHQPKTFWTPERVAELRKMAEDGVSLNRASIRLKRTRSSVQKKARELGLAFKDPAELRPEGTIALSA